MCERHKFGVRHKSPWMKNCANPSKKKRNKRVLVCARSLFLYILLNSVRRKNLKKATILPNKLVFTVQPKPSNYKQLHMMYLNLEKNEQEEEVQSSALYFCFILKKSYNKTTTEAQRTSASYSHYLNEGTVLHVKELQTLHTSSYNEQSMWCSVVTWFFNEIKFARTSERTTKYVCVCVSMVNVE